MATIQCPQCGNRFDDTEEFCTNKMCGYPAEFARPPADDERAVPGMPRRPGDQATRPITPGSAPAPVVPPVQPPITPPTPPRSVPLGPILGAIGAVVVIVGLVALLLTRGSEQGDEATESARPTTTTPSPSVEAPVDTVAWDVTGLEGLAEQGSQQITSIAKGDALDAADWSLIAAGSTTFDPANNSITSDGATDAAIWLSDDGGSWEQVDHFFLRSSGDQQINGITVTPKQQNHIVAVGSDQEGDGDAAVWLSQDGVLWERIPPLSLSAEGEQEMTRVLYSKEVGYIAAGTDDSGGDTDGEIWISPDGRDWTPYEGDELGGEGKQVVLRVTEFELDGEKQLVAVGSSTKSGSRSAAVWTSTDGSEWSTVQDPSGVFSGGEMRDVRVTSGRLIAVGSTLTKGDEDGAVWTSDDGDGWHLVSSGPEVMGGRGEQVIWRIIAPGSNLDEVPLLVAGGYDTGTLGADAGTKNAAIWYSDDGETWVREEDEVALGTAGNQQVTSLTFLAPRLLAVGFTDFGELDPAVWEGTLEG